MMALSPLPTLLLLPHPLSLPLPCPHPHLPLFPSSLFPSTFAGDLKQLFAHVSPQRRGVCEEAISTGDRHHPPPC
ncbi:hypothetical protein BKA81DRAFT_373375 [Phyllosticta paracitricarpa]